MIDKERDVEISKVHTSYFHQISVIHPGNATNRIRIIPLTIVPAKGSLSWCRMLGNTVDSFRILNSGKDQKQFGRKRGETGLGRGQRRAPSRFALIYH